MLMTSELIDFSPMYSVNVYLLQLVVGERCVGLWLCKSEALAHRGVQVIYSLPQVFTAGLLIFSMCREYTVCDYSKPFLQKPKKRGWDKLCVLPSCSGWELVVSWDEMQQPVQCDKYRSASYFIVVMREGWYCQVCL